MNIVFSEENKIVWQSAESAYKVTLFLDQSSRDPLKSSQLLLKSSSKSIAFEESLFLNGKKSTKKGKWQALTRRKNLVLGLRSRLFWKTPMGLASYLRKVMGRSTPSVMFPVMATGECNGFLGMLSCGFIFPLYSCSNQSIEEAFRLWT